MTDGEGYFISIVVPVYNAERYVGECLQSIRDQTCRSFECIVVDDGSTDGSGAVIEEFVRTDGRFRLLTQANQGAAAARNAGMQAAAGRYLAFADSDDRLHPDFFMHLAGLARGADCVMCGYQRLTAEGRVTEQFSHPDCALQAAGDWRGAFGPLYGNYVLSSMCNKLYRRELIAQQGLRLDAGRSFGEDLLFNLEFLKCCGSVRVTGEILYDYYDRNPHSLTAATTEDRVENAGLLYRAAEDFCREKGFALPGEPALIYLKSCFTALEKALARRDGSAEQVLEQVLEAPETGEILSSPPAGRGEAGLYRALLKTRSRAVILPLARARGWIKGALRR